MKGIVLKQWEVQAILVGRKSRLTRPMKMQPAIHEDNCQHEKWFELGKNDYTCSRCGIGVQPNGESKFKSSYQLGDILYVKETFFQGDILNQNEDIEEWGVIIYAAGPDRDNLDYESIKWRSSIHMQEDVARIFLKVTGVRVERLQDIQDCKENIFSEGIREYTKDGVVYKYAPHVEWMPWSSMPREPWVALAILWDSFIKGKDFYHYGWDANPWVWVIEFERISKEEAYAEGN